jgi:hypothetical protein
MIDNSELVDALDSLRANATPAVLEWTKSMALAAAHYAQRGGGTPADVAGFEALAELARVVAESAK